MAKPTLLIVIGSTRPGRKGLSFAQWFQTRAQAHGAFEVKVADLLEINLPFLDEPSHPRLKQYTQQHTKDWSAMVDAADAFVFVCPEYNFGFSAPLKNALDYLHNEWQYKPAGILSYGGVSAGTRAAQMLKEVLTALKMMPLPEAVSVPFFPQFLTDEGEVQANDVMETSATTMLNELAKWVEALRPLRAPKA